MSSNLTTTTTTNFVNMFNEGQFLIGWNSFIVSERPTEDAEIHYDGYTWCGKIHFTNFSNGSPMGYAGRCVDALAINETTYEFAYTSVTSAVYVPQINGFEVVSTYTTENSVYRYLDDGRPTTPYIAWSSYDEGSVGRPKRWAGVGVLTWMSTDEVQKLLNMTADEITPETFNKIYADAWTKEHEEEFGEWMKNQTQPAEENNNGSNAIADNPSAGVTRKLPSMTRRLLSATLRMFGI